MSEQALLQLIDLIYESSLNPSQWPVFLKKLAEAAEANQAAFRIFDFRNCENNVPAQFGLSPEALKEFEDYWGARDIYFLYGRQKIHTGWIEQSQEFLPDETLLASPFYNEFGIRANIFHQCGAIVAHGEHRSAALTILRERAAGQFGKPQRRLLRHLFPHVQRATEVHYRLSAAVRQRSQMEMLIEHLPVAVVFVDRRGKVLFSNCEARELFEKRKSLWVKDGALTCYSVEVKGRLQAAIARAAQTLVACDAYPGEVLRIERPSGRPLAVTVTPLPLRQEGLPEGTAAAIFIADPDRSGSTPDDLLRILFGLTPAEARLAALLFKGFSLEEAGNCLGVTRNTVATQLKSIFSKTHSRGQSDLMRLMGVLHAQKIAL